MPTKATIEAENTRLRAQLADCQTELLLLSELPENAVHQRRAAALDTLRHWCLLLLLTSFTISGCLIALDKAIDALATRPPTPTEPR